MISIIIPNYNGERYLKNCIESIICFGKTNYEIIIIDNASTDSNYKWIQKNYPQIIYKTLNNNYGFSKAVNEGIKIAKGEYILLLNNDTVLKEGFIESLQRAIEADKMIFAVCSQMIRYHEPSLIDDAGDEYTIFGWAKKNGDGYPISKHNISKEVFSACAGAAMYRKSILNQIGYLDESFFAYMEDIDISYRARVYGYKNMYCAEAKVLHIGSATSGSKHNAFKVKLAARNSIYVPYKNMPLLQLLLNMVFLILGYMIKYFYFWKKGFGKEYREGIVEGIKTCRKIQKVPFKWKHLKNYVTIEWLLIKNMFKYITDK